MFGIIRFTPGEIRPGSDQTHDLTFVPDTRDRALPLCRIRYVVETEYHLAKNKDSFCHVYHDAGGLYRINEGVDAFVARCRTIHQQWQAGPTPVDTGDPEDA